MMGILSPFELGILWATSSKSGDKWLLRNEDKYFVERIQTVNGGTIFPIVHARKGTIIWTLDVKRPLWEELLSYGYTGRTDNERIFPNTPNNGEFASAYIQCHSTLDLWQHKTRKGKQVKTLRLRIYAAPSFINELNCVIAAFAKVGIKTPQLHKNGKMGYLTYQSTSEVIDICDWILLGEHSPRFEEKVNKLKN